MDENLDPLTTDNAPQPLSHRAILVGMAVVVIAGVVLGSVLAGVRFGAGILTGGVLAFANYAWLKRSTRAIFDNAATASTGILAAKYVFRYVAIGAVLLIIYLTDAVPITAVIAGLGAFAVAVVIQGLKNIFTG